MRDQISEGTGTVEWWETDGTLLLAVEQQRAAMREREVFLVDVDGNPV